MKNRFVSNVPILYYVEKNYKKNGICYFYKPVFSRDKTSAVVKYWVDCGSLCGWGETVLMKQKKNGSLLTHLLMRKANKKASP